MQRGKTGAALPRFLYGGNRMNEKAKSLFGNIVPALGGLFVTYLYNVVDGIFVGRGVGAAALGAVNIAVPFITFVVAIAAMFPMGGATVVAIRMGRGDQEGANRAFMTAFSLTLLVSVLLTLVGMVFSQQLVDWSGASKLSAEMREMARQYRKLNVRTRIARLRAAGQVMRAEYIQCPLRGLPVIGSYRAKSNLRLSRRL